MALFFLMITNNYGFIFSYALMCLRLYLAFNSVEHIMRDVWIWLVILDTCMHNGASFFFIGCLFTLCFVIILWIIFNIWSRYLLWAVGVIIFFLMIYYRLFRYVLPWGQMIILGCNSNLQLGFYNSGIGENLVTLLWGGYFVSQTALKSIFRFRHFFLPFILVALCIPTYIIITCNIIQAYHSAWILLWNQISFYHIIFIKI